MAETAGAATVAGGDWRLYRRLLGHIRPWWFLFPISFLGYGLYTLGVVLLADVLQFLLDAVNGSVAEGRSIIAALAIRLGITEPGAPGNARLIVPGAILALTLLRAVGQFVGSYAMEHVARRLVHGLRGSLFETLLDAPASYFEARSQGSLLSRMTYNVEQVTGAATKAVKTLLRESLVVVGLVAYMLYLNWQLSLVVFAAAPPIALVVRWVGGRFRRYSRRIQVSMADVAQVSNETARDYREVRVFGAQAQQRERFSRASDNNLRQSLKLALATNLSTPVIQLLLAAGLAAMVWVALGPAMLASFTAGALAAFITAAVQLGKPVRQLSGIQAVLQRGLAAAEDIFVQLDAEPEPAGGDYRSARVRGDIRLQGVSFTYPGADAPALSAIDIHMPAGATIGLVGASGSGKTTLATLLLGFHRPDSGDITLDGQPLESYALPNLRQQFALVPQVPLLLRDSVRNNIAYGAQASASNAQVTAAARAAQALDFIDRLPQGFDTVLGDDGEGLSGGQRQRIALARAFLKDAPVLVLDEATSALDPESEQRIAEALEQLAVGRTVLVIAHRLATLERADLIIMLDAGRVVDAGSHADLLARCGPYARLCDRELVSA